MPTQAGNELISANVFELVDLQAGMHVGDLGCGNLGYFTFPAAKIVGNSGVVYAVDILKSVLDAVANKATQEGFSNVKTVWSNLEKVGATDIQTATLDLTMLHNMLFQSDRDDLVLQETYRLTKIGGKAMVIDWLKIATPFGPPAGDRTDPAEIKRFAEAAGFTLTQEFNAGPYHYGLLFTK
jgi:ubiquinone/menaquinone biosynthesis C-methylase UbiE